MLQEAIEAEVGDDIDRGAGLRDAPSDRRLRMRSEIFSYTTFDNISKYGAQSGR